MAGYGFDMVVATVVATCCFGGMVSGWALHVLFWDRWDEGRVGVEGVPHHVPSPGQLGRPGQLGTESNVKCAPRFRRLERPDPRELCPGAYMTMGQMMPGSFTMTT